MKPHAPGVGFVSVVAPPLFTFVCVVALWEGAVRALHVPAFLVPPPSAVLSVAWAERAALAGSLLTTAEGALLGFLLSVSLGTLVGLLFSLSRWLERGLYPYALFLQTVPIVAVATLLCSGSVRGYARWRCQRSSSPCFRSSPIRWPGSAAWILG